MTLIRAAANRLGLDNIRATVYDARNPMESMRLAMDAVLVDAPCSGEGMFRRHPETRSEWNPASPAGCAQRQRQILSHAASMLRPGGRLAYSTCTFNAVENEGVIEGFLAAHPEFSLLPFALPGLPDSDGALHIWPHQVRGEGHFVALLQKTDAGRAEERSLKKRESARPLPSPSKQETMLTEQFLREHIAEEIRPDAVFAGKIIALPDALPPLEGVKVLRAGLQIGEAKGKVFVPDHALALACRALRTLGVKEEEARAYQNGQVLTVDEGLKGFYVPVLDGMNLGWGKASDGQLKNHYPKGLRR